MDLHLVKESNPKDCVGSDKVPVHLWPASATILGSLGMMDGMLKYGRSNYRAIGIRDSIYHDAILRHEFARFEGEDLDPDSGLPHEAHLLACLAIIVDAKANGKLFDDRMFRGGYRQLIDEMTPHVKRLKDKYKDRSPKHFSISDNK